MWRKLHRLGVVQVVDGVVALPLDARTREQLEWVADEVLEAGGDASIWLAEAASAKQERFFAAQMTTAVTGEYAAVIADAQAALDAPPGRRRRTLGRLRRELRRIRARDFFPPAAADAARVAVETLALETEETPR